jgi:8-oxo-dGTP diphosphatase
MTLTAASRQPSFARAAPPPPVTTSVVVFTIRARRLELLLVRRRRAPFDGHWVLPGGAVLRDEDLEVSAGRNLQEKAGVQGVYLEQLYTFGRPDRDPRGRVVTVAYYALVPPSRLRQQPTADAATVGWFALDALPGLAFDHGEIVAHAHRRLVAKLDYSTIAYQFMPDEFTLSQLQDVYETILQGPLDKRNFRKRVLALGHLMETGRVCRNGSHRPARLFRVRNPHTVEIIK